MVDNPPLTFLLLSLTLHYSIPYTLMLVSFHLLHGGNGPFLRWHEECSSGNTTKKIQEKIMSMSYFIKKLCLHLYLVTWKFFTSLKIRLVIVQPTTNHFDYIVVDNLYMVVYWSNTNGLYCDLTLLGMVW